MSKQRSEPLRNPTAEKVGEELKRLTIASIEAFNDKDFSYTQTSDRSEFLTRISPAFEARVERVTGPLDWKGLGKLWQHLATTLPHCRFEIVSATVDVFSYGRASVFLETTAMVYEGVTWNRIMEYKWHKVDDGTWMHSGITSVSGSQGNSGMVL